MSAAEVEPFQPEDATQAVPPEQAPYQGRLFVVTEPLGQLAVAGEATRDTIPALRLRRRSGGLAVLMTDGVTHEVSGNLLETIRVIGSHRKGVTIATLRDYELAHAIRGSSEARRNKALQNRLNDVRRLKLPQWLEAGKGVERWVQLQNYHDELDLYEDD